MMSRLFKLPVLWLVISTLIVVACSPLVSRRSALPMLQTEQLTDAEQIAGETLAYLMEVVLGREGDPAKRSAWATRGLNLPLDYDLVSRRMFGTVPLRAELMVPEDQIVDIYPGQSRCPGGGTGCYEPHRYGIQFPQGSISIGTGLFALHGASFSGQHLEENRCG